MGKKKLEADIVELETALEHANAANGETQKVIKKYHSQIREIQGKLEKEQRAKETDREQLLASERKANTAQNGLYNAFNCCPNKINKLLGSSLLFLIRGLFTKLVSL